MSSATTIIRVLYRLFADFPTGLWVAGLEGTGMAEWTGSYELRKLQVSWTRVPGSGVVQDAAMCTFHFLNLTDGDPDATWNSADYEVVETRFDTFWGAIAPWYSDDVTLAEYVWRADGPAFKPHGASLSPTLRIHAASGGAGANTNALGLPPQCAISVTEVIPATFTVTDVEGHPGVQTRNRWGRFYLPAPTAGPRSGGGSSSLVSGRIGPVMQDEVADAVQAFYNGCVAQQIIPVVYSPTTGNAWSVDEIHVDDIWDVIRRRRYVTPLSREPRTITAP